MKYESEKKRLWKLISVENDDVMKRLYLIDYENISKRENDEIELMKKQEVEENERKKKQEVEENERKKKQEVEENELKEQWKSNPRSIFGPVGTPVPPVKAPTVLTGSGTFLNRSEELKTVWEYMISNWETRQDPKVKKTLLVTGQMFGSGKTTFGENLLNFDVKHIADEFSKISESPGKESLKRARRIFIDLQRERIPLGIVSLEEWISYLIWTNTLEILYGIPIEKSEYFWFTRRYSPKRCVDVIFDLCNLPLYIHFDEIGEIESSETIKRFGLSDTTSINEKVQLEMYYLFWKGITPLFTCNIFIYCTGKTFRISQLGMKMLGPVSPSLCKHIYLSSFSVYDIVDALKASLNIDTCSKEPELLHMARWLHEWTSGIPRFVYYGIDGIIKTLGPTKFVSFNLPDSNLYRENAVEAMRKAPGANLSFGNELVYSSTKTYLLPLLYAAAAGLNFKSDGRLPGVSNFTVQELVDRFGIYVSSVSSKTDIIQLLMPKLWRESSDISIMPEVGFLKTIYPAFLDRGKALELVLQYMISLRSNFRDQKVPITEVLPFLQNRISWANKMIVGPFKSISLDFKVTRRTKATKIRNAVFKAESIQDEDILLSFVPESATVDLCLWFDHATVGLQCKNIKKGFSMNNLRDELRKFSTLLLVRNKVSSLKNHALFVLVLTGKGTEEIEKYRGNVIDSKLIASLEKSENIEELKLPVPFQVLILTNDDNEALLGRENLSVLKEISV